MLWLGTIHLGLVYSAPRGTSGVRSEVIANSLAIVLILQVTCIAELKVIVDALNIAEDANEADGRDCQVYNDD